MQRSETAVDSSIKSLDNILQEGKSAVADAQELLDGLSLNKMTGGAKSKKSKKTTSKKVSKKVSKVSKKAPKKTKSKSKTLKRPESEYFKVANELRVFIKKQIPDESFNVVAAMAICMGKVIKSGNRDIDKIKKNFDKAAFLKDYNSEKKAYLAKQAAKKAA